MSETPRLLPMTMARVTWSDDRAVALRAAMDREMVARYTGRHDDDPDFLEKASVAFSIDPTAIVATVLALDAEGGALGHAAVRRLDGRLEVKRVIVDPPARGRGVARALMAEVERIARELDEPSIILQTGDRQPDAIALYLSLGYHPIPVYDPYVPITNSLCFEKPLR